MAAGYAVLQFTFSAMSLGFAEPRYMVASSLLLITAAASLPQPRPGSARSSVVRLAPIAVYAALVVTVCAFNLRTSDYRSISATPSGAWDVTLRCSTPRR